MLPLRCVDEQPQRCSKSQSLPESGLIRVFQPGRYGTKSRKIHKQICKLVVFSLLNELYDVENPTVTRERYSTRIQTINFGIVIFEIEANIAMMVSELSPPNFASDADRELRNRDVLSMYWRLVQEVLHLHLGMFDATID